MILVAGEALIDMTPARCGAGTGYLPHPGGSPYNVAIGLGRLDVPVAFLGRISTDALGRLLRRHLEASQVSLRYLVDAEEATTLAFVHMGDGEPEYSFYSERTADRMLLPEHLPAIPGDAAMHFGSISLALEPGASTLEGLMRRESRRRLLSLDPNVRPSLITDRDAYLRRLEGWVSLADLVKVSQADLAWLHPHQPPEAVASRWLELEVTVVDTVGAGDAFTSAALAWLHHQGALGRGGLEALDAAKLEVLLAYANGIAAQTCTRPGADPPRTQEVETVAVMAPRGRESGR